MTSVFTVRKHYQNVCTTMTYNPLPKHLCTLAKPISTSVTNISICLMIPAPNACSCQAKESVHYSLDNEPICCYCKKKKRKEEGEKARER